MFDDRLAYIRESDMPTALQETPAIPVTLFPPRKSWTRDECVALEVSGLLDQHTSELVLGELISRMSKGRLHAIVLMNVLRWLQKAFGEEFINSETPIDVAPQDNPTSEPQPDIVILKRRYDEFRDNPQPGDFNLVVEIANSSLLFDLGVKAKLYARARIAEFWVVDIQSK